MLPLTPELVLAPNIFLALLSIDVMVRALSSARRSSREQTSNARVTFSQRRPFPKLHALVLPSSLSSLPPFFLIVAPAFFLRQPKRVATAPTSSSVLLLSEGSLLPSGKANIRVDRRYESPRPVGDAPMSIGGRFLDHHDFGSDSRWLKLYYITSHLSLNVAFLYASTRRWWGTTILGWPFRPPNSDSRYPRIRIGLLRTAWSRTRGRRNREHWYQRTG